MQTKATQLVLVTAVLALLAPENAPAQITTMELEVVESPALSGQVFGLVGQYERLRGVAQGEIRRIRQYPPVRLQPPCVRQSTVSRERTLFESFAEWAGEYVLLEG